METTEANSDCVQTVVTSPINATITKFEPLYRNHLALGLIACEPVNFLVKHKMIDLSWSHTEGEYNQTLIFAFIQTFSLTPVTLSESFFGFTNMLLLQGPWFEPMYVHD